MNSKYKILLNQTNQNLKIPIEIKWDFIGQDDSIVEYQTQVVDEVVGQPKDFEVTRFAHDSYGIDNSGSSANYKFFFYVGGFNPEWTSFTTSTSEDWLLDYRGNGFSTTDLYYFRRSFVNSFFKLDFYDTPNDSNQRIYFTLIIPTSQGSTKNVQLIEEGEGSLTSPIVQIKIPQYTLDYVGDKEGFFIYWLRDKQFYNLDTFYMSAKFFSANDGQFIRMMNKGQFESPINQSNWWSFDKEKFFYNKVVLNYDNMTYRIFDSNDVRIGTDTNPMNWYEYINPLIRPPYAQ